MKKEHIKKLAHGITLGAALDHFVWLALGLFIGGVLMLYHGGDPALALWVLDEVDDDGLPMLLLVFLLARLIAIAQWPRKTPINYDKINWPGVVAANFISIVIGFMLLIITTALVAPIFFEALAKYLGGKM